MTIERKLTQDIKSIKRYFIRFKDACKELEILRQDLYNIDKIDFRIKYDKIYIVITLEASKRLVFIDANNRNYFISIECVDANINNYILSMFLIIANK